ncbi:MAG: hypothetical protein A2046_09390 [Bacteroidetes bacterium GWA2_30_7]|nr:MAG: hypothetical protein A2046_09390 [Bacteroidetes bacterium GWA2_30_7]
MLTEKQEKDYHLICSDEYRSENYSFKIKAFKEGFLFLDFKGAATPEDINRGFELRKKITEKVGFNNREYFEVWDFVYIPKANREGRLLISEYLSEDNNNLLSIVYTNCSLQQQITLRSGFSFIENKQIINILKKNNQEGITFGLSLINADIEKRAKIISEEINNGSLSRNYTINNFSEIWRQNKETIDIYNQEYSIIKNPDWVYYSANKNFSCSIEVIDNNIFNILCKGNLSKENLDSLFKLKNNIIRLLGLNKATIYQIFNFSQINIKSLIKEVDYLNDLLNISLELNNTNIFISNKVSELILKIKNKRSVNSWVIKNKFEKALHFALIVKEKMYHNSANIERKIPSKSKDKDILINLLQDKVHRMTVQSQLETEEILKMLSQVAWDKYSQPIQLDKINNEKLENIYYAIKLIFEDNQELLKQYKENNLKLLEINSMLSKEVSINEANSEAFGQNKEKYKKIFNNLVDIYFEINSDGNILEISRSISDIFNLKREDIIGMSAYDFICNKSDLEKANRYLHLKGRIINLPIDLKDNKGNIATFSVHAKFSESNNKLIIGSLREVTIKESVNNKSIVSGIDTRLINN